MAPFDPLPGQMQWPFVVEPHDHMLFRVKGKEPNTILTVERQIYTVRICEYTGPLFYGRFWCYEDDEAALIALVAYIERYDAPEPAGWQRAIDWQASRYRVRRAKTVDGKRVVYENEEEM